MTRPRSGYRSGFDRDDDRSYDRRSSGGYDRSSSGGDAASFFESSLREHPLLLGLGAALAGAVVGTLIPNSRYEHEAMGDHRNRLVDEGVQRGGRVARDALSSAERAIDAAVEEFANEFDSAPSDDADEDPEGESGAKASGSSDASKGAQQRSSASPAASGAAKQEDAKGTEDDAEKKSGS